MMEGEEGEEEEKDEEVEEGLTPEEKIIYLEKVANVVNKIQKLVLNDEEPMKPKGKEKEEEAILEREKISIEGTADLRELLES